MPKPPSKTASGQKIATAEQAGKLADQIADKPYGGVKAVAEPKAQNISISLPPALIVKLQDAAITNKRGSGDLKTVSAIIKDALEKAGY
jgi:hypothetical protein